MIISFALLINPLLTNYITDPAWLDSVDKNVSNSQYLNQAARSPITGIRNLLFGLGERNHWSSEDTTEYSAS